MTATAVKTMDFSLQHCEPCHKGVPPFSVHEAEIHLTAINGWALDDKAEKLAKSYSFRNFSEALAFVNAIGEIADKEGHHPDIAFGWGYVNLTLQTHAIGGLHRNDFILASKIDKLRA